MSESPCDSTFEPETSTLLSELDVEVEIISPRTCLPWGAVKDKINFPESVVLNPSVKPGEFVLQTQFAEFTVLANKKINQVLEPQNKEKTLSKLLQRGEDPNFDQLVSSLGSVAENCLPSLLRTFFEWYDRQKPTDDSGEPVQRHGSKCKGEKDYLYEKRDLAVDFLYCLVLIEVLKQLPYHPGYDDLINHVIDQVFRHFKYKEGVQASPNAVNINMIADLYAEVNGVLAQSRFGAVKKRFLSELKELRAKDQNPFTSHCIVGLLMGMKFFRVKMHPIEELQACVQFLHECGNYFLEVKDKDIRHALAGLFVEILLPVAAVAKNEVNVPVLKNFVEMMYTPTLDSCIKKKHSLALFPMVTCLLCVSQKQFFLSNWPGFLTLSLSRLRDRDPKMARVALESLYRLLWVYMIRIKCESNMATTSRLQSIVNSLFPKGSKVIMPRDTPLNIFVKIIQFIAQERRDFAMREIIYDLLCVGKPTKIFAPERMSIGLRAFLVIADSLQQREGEPPMPQTMGVLPSGNTLRFKKTFINKHLSEDTARSIGMVSYYSHVGKAFASILKHLDSQVGRPLLMIKTENANREPEEIITGERKPKIDLFRTCVAAMPRLLPEGLSQVELVDLLSRLTVHMDDELGKLAFQALQSMLVDLPHWRNSIVRGFVQFIERDVFDTFPQLLDQCHRRLISLITQWRAIAQSTQTSAATTGTGNVCGVKEKLERSHQEKLERSLQDKQEKNETNAEISCALGHKHHHQEESISTQLTLYTIEGFVLVSLCSCKPVIRKLAVVVLKEARNLFSMLSLPKDTEPYVLDLMDRSCPLVIEKALPHLPGPEKTAALSALPLDFQWLADRTSIIWSSCGAYQELTDGNVIALGDDTYDPWIECISIFMHPDFVTGNCSSVIAHAWPVLYNRLQALYVYIDPNTTVSDGRSSSLLRNTKKVTSERDNYVNLWKTYVVMGCCIAPPSHSFEKLRAASPEPSCTADGIVPERAEARHLSSNGITARDLFKTLVPLLKCDGPDMVREAVIKGLSHCNPAAFKDIVEELLPLIREAIDRKQENVKRRRKRDIVRLAVVQIFHYMAQNGIFCRSRADVLDHATGSLCATFVEYIDGARMFLESEADKDSVALQEIRLHFSDFIQHLIRTVPVSQRHRFISQDLRYSLFYLFATWSGRFAQAFWPGSKRPIRTECCTALELSAVQTMSAVLCCGSVFDPSGLNDDGYIYSWLDALLGTVDQKIYRLAQETVVLLLEFNPDAQTLLDWVIDRCYTGSHEVADGCFNALGVVFNNREYPCDHVAMLNVTLLYTGCPRITVHETAVQLLHLLYKRFFLDDVVCVDRDDDGGGTILWHSSEPLDKKALEAMLLSGPYSRSQLCLSETLARLHPELTMPIFSEITHRFQTALPSVRQLLLQYLLPWLQNMELVDPNLPPYSPLTSLGNMKDAFPEYLTPPLKGEGWGSAQATEMLLNNLFYITTKYGDDHAKAIEDLWATLVVCWPGNLQVIIRYIIVITGLAPNVLLPYAKRVVVYLGRAKPERLVDEMMNELSTIEPLTFNIERTPTPPFYRLTSLKKTTVTASQGEAADGATQVISALNKGQIHTKRHSAEDSSKLVSMTLLEKTPRANSTGSMRSDASSGCSTTLVPSVKTPSNEGEEDMTRAGNGDGTSKKTESHVPYPLPMPAFGGYFAPLSEMLPENSIPNPPYQRCNLAVMLLTNLIVDCVDIDWTVHLPLMLHIVFLGLDHSQQLIHEHCKQLLLNLLLAFSTHDDHFSIAKVLLGNKRIHEDTMLTLPTTSTNRDYSFIEGNCESAASPTTGQSSVIVDTLTPDSVSTLVDVSVYETKEQAAKALIEFLVTRKCQPLWRCEDITSKLHEVRSAEQLAHFQQYVLRVFHESLPQAHVDRRWAQEALHLALSCSSRHYAGRSFQVFRALCQPLSSGDLSDILSRLVETVAEQGEDMQGYVTEIMLTLEAAVDNLDIDVRPMMKELFLSTPNLVNKDPRPAGLEIRKNATVTPIRQVPYYHQRSVSHNVAMVTRRAITSSPPVMESRVDVPYPSPDPEDCRRNTNLLRSRSAQSLKQLQDSSAQDDKLTILAQMFWIAISLLESDFEYEFLLAVRLLDKVLNHLQPERPECQEKLEKILQLIDWPQFVGVQSLLLKGCTSPLTAEATWQLLSRLTICSTVSIIDPSQITGFPMNVIALLPCLVEHYEQPNEKCREVADTISRMCQEQAENLDNLATVMTLYSRGTFAKDSLQWTKCVVKYLYDVYSDISDHLVNFVVEVLDKGAVNTQNPVLQILHCLVHYIDITVLPSLCIHDLLRVVAKYIESPHWKESLKILKLCVVRSSSLEVAPPTANVGSLLDIGALGLLSHTSFAEAEVMVKKELPGRTMEFTFDQSQLPMIGGDLLELSSPECSVVETEMSESERQLEAPSSGSLVIDTSTGFGWKRPLPSQSRTRERLVNLLKCYGPRILIPKSPSVIFSHDSPSDTLERQTTMTNSSEERSIPADSLPGEIKLGDDSSTDQQIQALEAFDFLYEDPDAGYDFGGLKRDSMKTNESEEGGQVESSRDESSDDETPVEEFPHDLPRYDSTTLLNPTVLDPRTRHHSESSHSLRSVGSEVDIADLSPTSSSPSSAGLTYIAMPTDTSMATDDIEDVWRNHVNRVMTDNSGTHAVNTFHLFARLLQETRHCVDSVTKDACGYLVRSNATKNLATQLLALLDLLTTEMECPLVFVDAEAMVTCHLVEKHKFGLLEIHESYETYLMRREQTTEHLQAIKTTMKNSSISGCLVEHCSDELKGRMVSLCHCLYQLWLFVVEGSHGEPVYQCQQKARMVSLCHCLYQLHFQLVQLFEGYSKLLVNLSKLTNPTKVADLSKDTLELKEELQKAAVEQEPVLQLTNSVCRSDIETLILDSISSQNYKKAVQCMQQFKLLFPGDMFGVHPTDEVESILFVYCQHQSEVKPGVIAVCRSPHNCCEQVCAQLMEIKIQVSAAAQFVQVTKTHGVSHTESATAEDIIKLLDDAIMV